MSSENATSEVVRLGDYSLQVYRQCRDSPGQYQHLARDCRQLHNICIDLCDLIKQHKVPPATKSELLERGFGCKDVLSDVENTLRKYSSRPLKAKRLWDEQSWDEQGGRDLQLKLNACTIELSSFYSSLLLSPQARIQDALTLLITDYQSSNASDANRSMLEAVLEAANGRDEATWQQLTRDLEGLQISETTTTENRSLIADRLERILHGDILEDDFSDESSTRQLSISGATPIASAAPFMRRTEVDFGAAGPSYWSAQAPPFNSIPANPPGHLAAVEPPPYEDLSNPAMFHMAQSAVEAWNRRDWAVAMAAIDEVLHAVQSGSTVEVDGGGRSQPDVRVLYHLMGVAASFSGELETAKKWFELVLRRPYTEKIELDEAECAAARWLGDTCLMLDEPTNGVFAWAVAFGGHPGGIKSNHASKIGAEIKSVEGRIYTIHGLLGSLERENKDRTTILKTATLSAKIRTLDYAIKKMSKMVTAYGAIYRRQGIVVSIKHDHLLRPMTDQPWPCPYDPTFSCEQTGAFVQAFHNHRIDLHHFRNPERNPTTATHSMKSMPFTTKRDLAWLTATVRTYLKTHDMQFIVRGTEFTVILDQTIKETYFREQVSIEFKKMSMRNAYGFKVTNGETQTRAFMFGEEEEQRREKVCAELSSKLVVFATAAEMEAGQ